METISLPTKITRGPSASAYQSTAVAAAAGSRSQLLAAGRLLELAQPGGERLHGRAPLGARDRGEQARVDAGRAEADLGVGRGVVDGLAQAGGDVAGADQDARRAVAGLLRVGPQRSRSGITV